MPSTVVVFLLAPDFDSLVRYVEGVHKLPVGQEESHEVLLLDIRYIKDEAKRRVGLQGQGEVGPDRWKVHRVIRAEKKQNPWLWKRT